MALCGEGFACASCLPCNPSSRKRLGCHAAQGLGETGRALMTGVAEERIQGPRLEAGIKFSRDRLDIAGRFTNWNGDATGRVPVRRVY